MLPQDNLDSTVICGMVVRDLPLFSSTSVKWAHYIDDTMLTCEDLPLLQDTADCARTSARERMGGEPKENSRSRNYHKVIWESFGQVRHILSQKL